jgi:hypothetical protein
MDHDRTGRFSRIAGTLSTDDGTRSAALPDALERRRRRTRRLQDAWLQALQNTPSELARSQQPPPAEPFS